MRSAVGLLLGIIACGESREDFLQLERRARRVCPRVDVDALAGDWVQLIGAVADGSVRMRIEGDPTDYRAYHVAGLDRTVLHGAADGGVVRLLAADGARLELEPVPKTCSVRATWFDGPDKSPRAPVEFLELPDIGVRFAYAPPTEPLEVAVDPGGGADAVEAGFTAPVDPVEAECTFAAEVWLDGLSVATDVPADAPVDGARRWHWTWRGLSAGEHLLELTRLRRCGPDATEDVLGTAGARVVVTGLH